MKTKLFVLLFFVSVFASSQNITTNFSFGGIGGGIVYRGGKVNGVLNGDFFNIFAFHAPSRLGLEASPFHYQFSFDNSANSTPFAWSLINLTLFHQTRYINESSILGPFFGIHYLDLDKNIPSYVAGIRFCYRNKMDIDFYGLPVKYRNPILYKYVDLEAGIKYEDAEPKLFANVSVDASFIIAVIAAGLYSAAEENSSLAR